MDLLKNPISEQSPCGVDIRQAQTTQNLYYDTKELREQARQIERQGLDEASQLKQLWQSVYDKCVDILQNHSKDLEINVWLIEALVRLEGLSGLIKGFSLVHYYCQHYWENLYPQIDEDGVETRLAPLAGLNGISQPGTLIMPLKQLMLTQQSQGNNYAFWQYEQEDYNNILLAVKQTSSEFYKTMQADLNDLSKHYSQLSQLLEQLCGNDAPPSSYIKNTIIELQDCINSFIKPEEKLNNIDDKQEDIVVAGETISNRQKALNTLLEVADYFTKAEPHSPLPYLLKRAVHWGNLSLPDLLQELIDDESARSSAFHLTGINEH